MHSGWEPYVGAVANRNIKNPRKLIIAMKYSIVKTKRRIRPIGYLPLGLNDIPTSASRWKTISAWNNDILRSAELMMVVIISAKPVTPRDDCIEFDSSADRKISLMRGPASDKI